MVSGLHCHVARKELVILGAGTAGTLMAHKLRRALPDDAWNITVLDQDRAHIYQPGLLFVPFGATDPRRIVRPRESTLPDGVKLRVDRIERLDPVARRVHFVDGSTHAWDVLVIATGTRLDPAATAGLTGPGWYAHAARGASMFDFYSVAGATALGHALERFERGRLVINFVDVPIKCPVAPLEFAFLADAFFTKRGRRKDVEIVFATPLDGAFTKPRASALLGHLLNERGIVVEPSFALAQADGERRVLQSYDGRELNFDLLVTVPLHAGAELISRSGLGDAQGFVPTDKHTLQSKAHPHVFVIGDATDVPTSKAGSVAHFQGETLAPNILRYLRDEPLSEPSFDGHAEPLQTRLATTRRC